MHCADRGRGHGTRRHVASGSRKARNGFCWPANTWPLGLLNSAGRGGNVLPFYRFPFRTAAKGDECSWNTSNNTLLCPTHVAEGGAYPSDLGARTRGAKQQATPKTFSNSFLVANHFSGTLWGSTTRSATDLHFQTPVPGALTRERNGSCQAGLPEKLPWELTQLAVPFPSPTLSPILSQTQS